MSGYSAGDNWKDKCLDILRAVLGVIPADQRFIFDRPVDQRLVPDYYNIIKRPMDLGTITHNLQTGKYDGPLQFCEVRQGTHMCSCVCWAGELCQTGELLESCRYTLFTSPSPDVLGTITHSARPVQLIW